MGGRRFGSVMTVTAAIALLLMALHAGPRSAAAQEVILYDFENFGGRELRLSQSAPSLTQFSFDNDVESIRVISGQWSFHRDDGFQNFNGPSITLGPGDYPSVAALGFAPDRMSSVRLLSFDDGNGDAGPDLQPVPSCSPPYQTLGANNQCVFTCAEGTEPDIVSGDCQCSAGLREIGTDAQGRRICRASPTGPVQGGSPTLEGNTGALPTFPVTPGITVLPPGQIREYIIPAGQAMRIARQQGFTFLTDANGTNAVSCDLVSVGGEMEIILNYNAGLFGWEAGAMHLAQGCTFRLFGGRQLNTGWAFSPAAEVVVRDGCARQHGRILIGQQSGQGIASPVPNGNPYRESPNLLIHAVADVNGNTCTEFRWRVDDVRLRGPAGADWRDAFR
ncbi:beta/gamma crystallin-related protein [Nioella aestuarii]|uniref:beta/gamma crystallin-related protein n=1 Tax=Nioella aestuarii TaxID=1662864 RepID=UPI003D7FB961